MLLYEADKTKTLKLIGVLFLMPDIWLFGAYGFGKIQPTQANYVCVER